MFVTYTPAMGDPMWFDQKDFDWFNKDCLNYDKCEPSECLWIIPVANPWDH